ncbi:sulfite exporter TauE/SafE family protein [Aquabacterium sp. A7-Y]|uniref:sulfite exporter TauE/SafE family protein n=1 Tax=Aquabacterium sp. A7-Y TaxID=1349605 RepID=UPI00223DE2A2|nr:sulfite exporter TauE/SafE family protein [Aquabacterium sp. A7-Y]MCW7538864.1 sulfite exporter TauE/SafE family protein [Aquabacterium sp. A7-Y]
MNLAEAALIGAGAFAAGAVNSVAGGGTFFSFPALLAVGVPPVVANASNSVSLWPGSLSGAWAYKRELAPLKRYLVPMGLASLAGGVVGGVLLLRTQDSEFARLIPWLLAFATALFAFSPRISALLARWRAGRPATAQGGSAGGWLTQLLVSVYGGFFGAGMGILMMASLAIAGHEDVQEVNAIKNLLSAVIYSVTVVTFIVAGAVSWPHTLLMILTATLGGYWGATVARKVPAVWLRRVVIAVAALLTLHYFMKFY